MAVTKNASRVAGNPPTRLQEEPRDDVGDKKFDEQGEDTPDEYDNDDEGGGMVLLRWGIVPEFVFVCPEAFCLRTEAIFPTEGSCW